MGQHFLVFCSLTMTGCFDQMPVDKIELCLAQDVTKVTGVTWPKSDQDGKAMQEFASIENPVFVTLHLPNGKKLGTFSKITFLSQRQKMLSRVVVSPLREAGSFKQAVDVVSNLARDLGIQNDDRVRLKIREFQTKPPEWDETGFARVSLSCNLGKETNIYMEIRPGRENDKWIVTVSFLALRFYELP